MNQTKVMKRWWVAYTYLRPIGVAESKWRCIHATDPDDALAELGRWWKSCEAYKDCELIEIRRCLEMGTL